MRITEPLRIICADAIKNPFTLFDREEHILTLFAYTMDCISHITSIPLEDINDVLTEKERRKGLITQTIERNFRGKDFS